MDPSALRNLRARGLQLDTSSDSTSDTVLVQQALNETSICRSRLLIDGKYGPRTEEAVKEFQEKNMQKVDGVVGPQTLRSLYEFLGKLIGSFMPK